jgi:RNA polymerase sigma-70 factor (ECF subfamily)
VSDLDHVDIRASQQGDHEAYRRLVQRYEAVISRLMWRFSQQAGVCEELVQEAFVEAYMSLGSFKFRGPFEGWLKRIATRTGYRYWKQQRRARQSVPLDETPALEAPPTSAEPADAALLANKLLERLPPTDRLVLTLLYFDECNTEEIAQRMGWTRAMVKMRAYRARSKLKEICEREQLLEHFEWTR